MSDALTRQTEAKAKTTRGTENTFGQIIRMVFYMATRYETGDNASPENMPDLIIVDRSEKQSGQPTIGDLCTLVKWNEEFAVTDFEKRRNDRVQELQCNRDPFIDHPEFVDSIWTSKC